MRKFLPHLLYHSRADIDIDDILVSILVHLVRELTIAAANHKNLVLFHDAIFPECVLELRILGIPIEESTVLDISIFPEGGTCILLT